MSMTGTAKSGDELTAMEQPPIELTEAAIRQIRWLLDRQGNPALFLRIGVKGGGCTGYSYVLDLQAEKSEWDTEYNIGGVPVVIDKKSRKFLEGMTLDFDTSDLMLGGGFVFHNPNAKKTCGCGSSFTI